MRASVFLRSSILAFSILLSACAATGVREVTQNTHLPRRHELVGTPFFSQELYQCGPAALATALNAVEIKVTPEQLKPEVYIPSRQGSLQIEMLAAARRHGALAIQIPPKLEAVMQEIAAGNVVVVLQNIGLSWVPAWHYAVVVGYDLDKEKVWLRSGTFNRFEMTLSTFQRTWARSEYWAFVTLKPGNMPASTGPDEMIKALIAFEKSGTLTAKITAYHAAVKRWPDNLVLLMGFGNNAYMAGDLPVAANAFQRAIDAHPTAAVAYNNLANVLLAQKKPLQAEKTAEKGLELAGQNEKLKSQIAQTLLEIKAYKIHQSN